MALGRPVAHGDASGTLWRVAIPTVHTAGEAGSVTR
jgi:hypothetical protein